MLETNADKIVALISLIDEFKVDEFKALAKRTDLSDPNHNGLLLTAALDHQHYHFFDVLVDLGIKFSGLSSHLVLFEMLFNTEKEVEIHPAFITLLKSDLLIVPSEKQSYFVKAALLTYGNQELAQLFIRSMPHAFDDGDVIGGFLMKKSTDQLTKLLELLPGEVKDTVANDKLYNALSTWGSELDVNMEKASSVLGFKKAQVLLNKVDSDLVKSLKRNFPPVITAYLGSAQ